MKIKGFRIVGIILILIGIILLANSLTNITGFAIVENLSKTTGSVLGIVFIIMGVLISTTARMIESGLEKTLKLAPGKGVGGEFVKLTDVLKQGHLKSNKVGVEIKGDVIYRDGRPIQGLKLSDNYVEFLGYHFTSHKTADIIEDDESFLVKNLFEPYVYFLEPRDYSAMTENDIKFITGANSASDVLIAKVKYPIDKIYLKFQKGYPTSIAVEGDIEPDNLIRRKGKYITHKETEEL